LFGSRYQIDIGQWKALPVNEEATHDVDVVVCTTRGQHLLDQLGLPSSAFSHVERSVEPMLLEFECQEVLKQNLGKYDLYWFLEDDLVIHDPFFLRKLLWFNERFGKECLLQPNRFEFGELCDPAAKLYIDGPLPAQSTAPFQNIAQLPELTLPWLDSPIRFVRPVNPHAGCYFLTKAQMAHWSEQPHFLDRDVSWCGPLESAATLGIMKTFRVYKPAAENMDIFELEHRSRYNLNLVGKEVPFDSLGSRIMSSVTRLMSSVKSAKAS
jgi:hypothetical protein